MLLDVALAPVLVPEPELGLGLESLVPGLGLGLALEPVSGLVELSWGTDGSYRSIIVAVERY